MILSIESARITSVANTPVLLVEPRLKNMLLAVRVGATEIFFEGYTVCL